MNRLLQHPKVQISPLRLHSVSTVHLKPNNYDIFSRKLSVRLPRTNFHSATSVFVPNSTSMFNNKPFVKLTPLGAGVLNKFNVHLPPNSCHLNSRHRDYHSISKCNRKRCRTCKFLSSKSVIKSTVNGRNFTTIIPSDIS